MKESFYSTNAKEFRQAYSLKNAMTNSALRLSLSLIAEEFNEVKEAADEVMDKLWLSPQAVDRDNRAHLLKEVADLVYVCHQLAATFDWDLDEAYKRVHASNMSKLGTDGNPIYREDGKILKGPNYFLPNLFDLV